MKLRVINEILATVKNPESFVDFAMRGTFTSRPLRDQVENGNHDRVNSQLQEWRTLLDGQLTRQESCRVVLEGGVYGGVHVYYGGIGKPEGEGCGHLEVLTRTKIYVIKEPTVKM